MPLTSSLDSNTYTSLQEHIAAVTKSSPAPSCSTSKTSLTSAALRVVIAAQKAMKVAGGEFAMTNLQPQIRKVFEIIMALPSLNVFESVADLDRYLTGIQKKVLGKDQA